MNSCKIGDIVVITSPISNYNGYLAEVVEAPRTRDRVRLKVDGVNFLMWFFTDEVDK